MSFEIENFQSLRLSNVNPRMEKHGPEPVPAVDLNFVLMATNGVLSSFDGGWLSALYRKAEQTDTLQGDLDGVPNVASLAVLRFPKMAPIKWDWKGAGYMLEIDYGLGGGRNLVLEDCTVGKVVLDCKDGGVVEVKFQVQCDKGLTEHTLGKLALMIGQEVDIELLAPKTLEQTGAQFEPLFPNQVPDKPLTAEDVFISTAAPTVQ